MTNASLTEIIIQQHPGLKANEVKPSEIRSILESDKCKVLLLIDGHDEYKTGRNTDIDEAIKKEKLWNCWIILTSRETEQIKDLKQHMDAETEIHGFDKDSVKIFIEQTLQSPEKCEQLLKDAAESGLYWKYNGRNYEILSIPIVLKMIRVLYRRNLTLPKTRTRMIQEIVYQSMDREAIRMKGQKAVDSSKQALVKLGKLAWKGLCEPEKKLIFEKVMKPDIIDIFIDQRVSTLDLTAERDAKLLQIEIKCSWGKTSFLYIFCMLLSLQAKN